MILVYADMVADLFHHGHVEFLKKGTAMGGDYDGANVKRQPILTVEERVAFIAGCRYVDEVIPNNPCGV